MQNSMVVLTFFKTVNTLLGKFGPKNQNCDFKLKFVLRLIQIYAIFNGSVNFFCFRLEIPFLANSVQKLKIVSLS